MQVKIKEGAEVRRGGNGDGILSVNLVFAISTFWSRSNATRDRVRPVFGDE